MRRRSNNPDAPGEMHQFKGVFNASFMLGNPMKSESDPLISYIEKNCVGGKNYHRH